MAERAGRANLGWGRRVVGALRACGVAHFVISPGSRSTPLALAVGALEASAWTVVLDERSAAFRALGRIKTSGRPVAVVCTSGTAAAEYYAAVIEAREAGLPLVVLTADRPPELRHCHAPQTIDQVKLYGDYPVFAAELPVPEVDPALARAVEALCRRAVASALGEVMGPVHLNCPFREPFFGEGSNGAQDALAVPAGRKVEAALSRRWRGPLRLPERTLWLAGPLPMDGDDDDLRAVAETCRAGGWPLLVDGCHPLRWTDAGVTDLYRIGNYDSVARRESLWASLRPEAVVVWGDPPTSKVLRGRLEVSGVSGWRMGAGGVGHNPLQLNLEEAGTDIKGFVEAVAASGDGGYGRQWQEAERAVGGEADKASAGGEWFEGDLHRLLPEVVAAGTPVLYANSLAVRGAEWFVPVNEARLRPQSLRGANGIDGTLSVARGMVEGAGRPGILVTGDLAFLHDSNGLLGGGLAEPGLLVLLLNNGGGGIFDYLPVAQRAAETFEVLFGTPQAVDFGRLASAYGASWRHCESVEAVTEELGRLPARGIRIVECRLDRRVSLERHKAALDAGKASAADG